MSGNQIFQDDLLNSLVNPNWRNESIEEEKNKAFDEGFQRGLDAQEIAIKQFFISNVEKATNLGETLYTKFKNLNFNCQQMMLKAIDIKSFEILYIVNEQTYLSPLRKEVYNLIRQVKKEHNSNEFSIECLLMPENGNIDTNLIVSDGYSLKYEPKSR